MEKKGIYKIDIIIIVILFVIGVTLQFSDKITEFFSSNNINLSLSEIDTDYGTKEEQITKKVEVASPVDTSWKWPTDSNYHITTSYSNYHPAIDIVPNGGDYNIYSSYSGEVITNSYKFDNGNYLVIKQDNGYFIMYAHLSQKLVNVGDKVRKGQVIGIMGRTGFATGVHLHYAVWEGYPHMSTPVNPYSFY